MQPRADPGSSRTLGGTASVSAVSSLLRAAAGFAAGVIVARSLGPDGRGQFAFVTATVALVVMMSNLGVTSGLVEAHAKRARTTAVLYAAAGWIGLLVGAVASSIFTVSYVVFGDRLFHGVPVSAAVWVAVLIPPSLALQHWTAVGYIDDRVREFSLAMLAGSVLFLLLVAGAAFGPGLELPTTISLWGLSVLVPVVLVLRRTHLRLDAEVRRTARGVLLFGARVNVATLAAVITWRLDVFIVKALRGSEELGQYAVAVAMAEVMLIIGAAARTSLVRSQSKPERAGLDLLLARVTRLAVAGALLAWILSLVAAGPVVVGVYGRAFQPAVSALIWLVPGIGALILQGPLSDYLLTEGHVRTVTAAAVTAMAVNVVFDLALIPKIGFVAASMGSTLAYTVGAGMILRGFRRHTGIGFPLLLIPRGGDLAVLRERG